MSDKNIFVEEEKEILQEIMNIAFGNASAALTDVIDTHVLLSVPNVLLLSPSDLIRYMENEIKNYSHVSLVEQNFWGQFKGKAFLIFPARAAKELVALFASDQKSVDRREMIALLEKETLLEVGNILIGACVGKVAELLEDVVTYSPPRVIVRNNFFNDLSINLFEPDNTAIIMKTVFDFEEREVSGFLFLLTGYESFGWLKKALHRFLEQYE